VQTRTPAEAVEGPRGFGLRIWSENRAPGRFCKFSDTLRAGGCLPLSGNRYISLGAAKFHRKRLTFIVSGKLS
jgi:hypothetical protein